MKKIFLLLFAFSFAKDSSIVDIKSLLIQQGIKRIQIKEKVEKSEISTKKLTIDLKNPTYINGILTTYEGGVIKNENLRIQAKVIQYIKKKDKDKEVHLVEADQDIMVIYKNRVFVGEELHYDFIKKEGSIYNARTYAAPWYLKGDKILLKSDGTYEVENTSITTCENVNSSWDINAKKVRVEKKDLIKAKKIRFRLFKFPTLWLPSLKINLKKFLKKPIIKYKVNWDKKVGPRASLRYQAYSWRDFLLFLRGDYRFKTGLGGALESEYKPDHKRTSLISQNYLAEDSIPKDPKKKKRYRIQGALSHVSKDANTNINVTWDKFSDIKMPSDFKSDDFEINTAKKTEATLRHIEQNFLLHFHARPKVNAFESLKQDIPTFYINIKPQKIKNTKLFFSNEEKFSYLKMSYSDDISPSLLNIHSFRLESQSEIYRTINLKNICITPKVGYIFIVYNRAYEQSKKILNLFSYGGKINTVLFRNFSKHTHRIEPYIQYIGLTKPRSLIDDHYIFSIDDGYNKLNMIKVGILNEVFSKNKINPRFSFDLYSNGFLTEIRSGFPKTYLDIDFLFPSLLLSTKSAWNADKNILDFCNTKIGWTANENVALALEFRHRCKYRYRKADHRNYILDVSRPEPLLLNSPISDRRNTVLTHFFFKINPFLAFHFESHSGFKRKSEPHYNEYKIDLYTMISSNWKIRISFQHTKTDNRFSFDYFLLKI